MLKRMNLSYLASGTMVLWLVILFARPYCYLRRVIDVLTDDMLRLRPDKNVIVEFA